MRPPRLQALLLPLLLGTLAQAAGPGTWDAQYTLTPRQQGFELAYLPLSIQMSPRNTFADLRVSLGVTRPHDCHDEGGVRVHLDAVGGDRTWYAQAGAFLVGGEGVGAGVGLRLGGGHRFNNHARAGLVTELMAGTEGARAAIGLQLGLTF